MNIVYKTMTQITQQNIEASFVLHALGDTIGFKNGEWEFNYYDKTMNIDSTDKFLYDFIELGGINDINLKGWLISDDTILNIATCKGILATKNIKNTDDLIMNIKKELVASMNSMKKDKENGKNRYIGNTTMKYIELMENTEYKTDGRYLSYDVYSGGNGAAMRMGPIGLIYSGEKNRQKLIDASIDISKLTHNSANGYLAGLCVALFSAFVVERVSIIKWVYLMLDLMRSDMVKKHLDKNNKQEQEDYNNFINYWQIYLDTRFADYKPVYNKSHYNLILRSKYYHNYFTLNTKSKLIGYSGFCATIMAYDSLLDCEGSWEKLIIYSALHVGDSDTVACIAGFWYGLIYGYKSVPTNNLLYIERKKELIELSRGIYKLFK